MGRQATATITALTGVLLLASGCGPDKQGQPAPTTVDTSAATAALWDPCTQIPDQLLRQIGVDPATKKSDILDVPEPGWKICDWHDSELPHNFNVGVLSTIHTVDEFKAKKANTDFANVSVQGRSGFTYRDTSADKSESCYLALPTAHGAVEISAFDVSAKGKQIPPCERAKAAAEILAPVLPR
ncbi:DUF3558 domain-containing protein [Nocardia arthritidis]|uniref:DUF3558 domain-containing protein n=1 Tax=Nocardia arthritidis TaxID=228602 RepID=UPI00142DC1F6|nr:DUF3558 domain-containing protein [Nocardia arthritidis]